MYPSYLNFHQSAELKKRAEKLESLLESCALCPRQCRVNRLKGEQGVCRAGALARVYSFHLHQGEEPPISGTRGSGTIFFSHCNSHCLYCQNYPFSQLGQGKDFSASELAEVMLALQKQGAHNINLVSPTQFSAQIVRALSIAVQLGLKIPLVYNTMAYDSLEVLRLLEGLVDIYLPDIRYADDETALKYSSLPNYVQVNQAAVREMYRQVGNLKVEKGLAQRGLIVRHLVLPHQLSGTVKVMEFLAREISQDVAFSLMSQYYPLYQAESFPLIARQINPEEWQEAVAASSRFGLENGWIQERPSRVEREKFLGVHLKPVKNC